ncbi:hypothetical protein [Rhizobium sp. AG855]|uniref:hypothetical protein n=1 Tax=Rhizobium sp. AG855 TaxID=2183898 RepID=UPI0011C47F21|nr:hypothetical protein [Rhizobium sp. AG855]
MCSIITLRRLSQSPRKVKSEQYVADEMLNNPVIAGLSRCNLEHTETVSFEAILASEEMDIEGLRGKISACGGSPASAKYGETMAAGASCLR